jgi:regulatory protein
VNRPRPPADADSVHAAYLRALKWLTARELSEGQVRSRLLQRGFSEKTIEGAIDRLVQERTLDDRRTARAVARLEARVRRHGRRRVYAKLRAMQIDRDLAGQVTSELFAGTEEAELLGMSLDRRLRGNPERLKDPRERRRIHAYLVREGFSASSAAAAIRSRLKP